MDKNTLNTFIQENIVYILIPIIVLVAGVYFAIGKINTALTNYTTLSEKKQEH